MKTQRFMHTPLASLVMLALYVNAAAAEEQHDHTMMDDDSVMIVTAPVTSPLEIVTSPKRPRQPVPASDGSDYLKTIPGFSQIRAGGTNGDPVFRGMFGSRLRILTNNGEMLGACPARMDAPSSYISPESFDVLTLIKGPQTVLWGPGNSAGTIRFDREQPHFEKPGIQGNASLLAASNNRWDENADISLGSEEGYLRLMGNKSRSSDYKDGNGDRVPSKWDKWNGDMAIGWTLDKDTLIELTAGKGDGESRYAGRSMDGSQFKRESLGARFEKSNIGDVFQKFEANVYYNYADHIMDNYSLRSPGSGMSDMTSGMSGDMSGAGMSDAMDSGSSMDMDMPMAMEVDRRTVGGRMMGTWAWDDIELRSGADTQLNTHRNKMDNVWVKDARFHDYGIFSELTWTATDASKVVSGMRLDRVLVDNFSGTGSSERTDTLPAGFFRFEHNLSEIPLMLYAGIGYTERFPDYWELFSPTYGPDGSTDAFDKVKTEKTTQIDIGAQYAGKQFNSWVSAYVGRVNDFILFRYDPNDAYISQADNVNATIMGGEAGISYKLTDSWKTDASLAYSWGRNTDDGRPLPQTPPLEARLGLSWESGDWSSTGLVRLVSSQHRVAINEGNVVGKDFDSSAGFAVVSANAAYRVNKYFKVSAGVDNLLDKDYSEHLNLAGNSSFGYSANTAVNEPGRTFWGKINVTF
ncbi:TonB-dependent receptor domain-containing protein [Klebsiella pneumoniae]|uniref:TonB-dependent receptor domain-containing protein n=1 Tax=Klebsiella pneumoniae TaxID=573 RepID=UPI000DE724AA|nr:TonB-dependent receptor [Klebsiella pneumoniae]SSG25485.1 outer membrane receptor FepA [Klebsiella pneumoniae]